MPRQITAGRFHAADGVEDWRCLYHLVSAHFRTDSLAQGIAFVDAIELLSGGAEQHHLNVDLRSAGVTMSLGRRDIALARRISAAVKELDLPADPTTVQVVNVTLDALVGADVLPPGSAANSARTSSQSPGSSGQSSLACQHVHIRMKRSLSP